MPRGKALEILFPVYGRLRVCLMKENEGMERYATTAIGSNVSRGTADTSLVLMQRNFVESRRDRGHRRRKITKSCDYVGLQYGRAER